MMLDRWMLTLGLATVEGEIEEATREILIQSAESFLRGGGSITLEEWSALSEESKASFVTAGDRLRAMNAYMIGISALSRGAGLAVLAGADGGEQLVREVLEKSVRIASSRIAEKRPVETAP